MSEESIREAKLVDIQDFPIQDEDYLSFMYNILQKFHPGDDEIDISQLYESGGMIFDIPADVVRTVVVPPDIFNRPRLFAFGVKSEEEGYLAVAFGVFQIEPPAFARNVAWRRLGGESEEGALGTHAVILGLHHLLTKEELEVWLPQIFDAIAAKWAKRCDQFHIPSVIEHVLGFQLFTVGDPLLDEVLEKISIRQTPIKMYHVTRGIPEE